MSWELTLENYDKQKARLTALVEKWVKPIGLAWWTIHMVYEGDPREFKHVIEKDGHKVLASALAECNADWRYMEATITWNMFKLITVEFDDDELEKAFVHELMHIFLNEMREEGIEHEERVATTLANAFLWVVKDSK